MGKLGKYYINFLQIVVSCNKISKDYLKKYWIVKFCKITSWLEDVWIYFFLNRWIHEAFHRLDRAMIYLFIAGSYTPWLALKTYMPHGGLSVWLEWAIWPISAIGILYQQLFHERNKLLSTVLYVIIAVFPALVVFEMVIVYFLLYV